MAEGLEFVDPEYEKLLVDLAERLVTPERYGEIILNQLVEPPVAEHLLRKNCVECNDPPDIIA